MIEKLLAAFRKRKSNLLKNFPWCELDRGVMHTHDGFYVAGLEVEVPNTSFSTTGGAFFRLTTIFCENSCPKARASVRCRR